MLSGRRRPTHVAMGIGNEYIAGRKFECWYESDSGRGTDVGSIS